MDEPTKRAWRRPELVVLVRSGPEEAVLVACKQWPWAGVVGSLAQVDGCYTGGDSEPCPVEYCRVAIAS